MTSVQQATRAAAFDVLALHRQEHSLLPPLHVDFTRDEHVVLWVDTFGCERWVDSIHVDADGFTPTDDNPRYVWRQVDGRLPLLGIKVRLRFLQATSPLRVVEGGGQ